MTSNDPNPVSFHYQACKMSVCLCSTHTWRLPLIFFRAGLFFHHYVVCPRWTPPSNLQCGMCVRVSWCGRDCSLCCLCYSRGLQFISRPPHL
jgi:hypothetical protein